MGVDLTLLPIEHRNGEFAFSHTVLSLDRDRQLFEQIMKLKSYPVPTDLNSYISRDDSYEESHYGKTVEDAYGEPVMMVKARKLIPEMEWWVNDGPSKKNQAVRSYLQWLDPNTDVALFWH